MSPLIPGVIATIHPVISGATGERFMTDLEVLHNEKLTAHSRENDGAEICDDCDEEYPDCKRCPEDCQEAADQDAAENRFEGMRDAYD
jgi:hypothetical protein